MQELSRAPAVMISGSRIAQCEPVARIEALYQNGWPGCAKALNRLRDSLPPDGLDGERYPEGRISGSGRVVAQE
jgi:hypothetical protein